jgi:hypothetical protein
MPRLKGRVALITGAGTGIGRATELDPENGTVGQGGTLPLKGAGGAGAGHEADTEEAQRGVQGEGGAGGGQGIARERGTDAIGVRIGLLG